MEIKRLKPQPEPQPLSKQEEKTQEKPAASRPDTVELGKARHAPQPLKPNADWLFMSYIAADTDMATEQLRALDAMETVGSDSSVHIASYIDVGPAPNTLDGKWSNCRSYYVTRDSDSETINSELIQDFGAVDMTDSETLKKFIIDAMHKFPADHVVLVMNSHGGGFTGAMIDRNDSKTGKMMSVPEIKEALSGAEEVTGKKIDILAFDACIMAETEVAYELKDNANILLASEDIEIVGGWKYAPILESLSGSEAVKNTQEPAPNRTAMEPEEFAKTVVQKQKENSPEEITTFSATDLTKINQLGKAVNELAKAIKQTREKDEVKKAIKSSETFDIAGMDIYDLHHICKNLMETVQDKKIIKAAQKVITSLDKIIIANETNPDFYPNSKGLSIYAPTTVYAPDIDNSYKYNELAFARDTEWDEALKALNQDNPPPPPPLERPDLSKYR